MSVKKRLSNTHRTVIASNMTRAAIKTKLTKLVKTTTLEVQVLRELLSVECHAALPELSKERVQQLLQSSVLRGLGKLGYRFNRDRVDAEGIKSLTSHNEYDHIQEINLSRNSKDSVKDDRFLMNVFSGQSLGPLGYFRRGYCLDLHISMSAPELPATRNGLIDTQVDSKESKAVLASMKRLNKLNTQWKDLVVSAETFYNDVEQSLVPINAVAQFLEFYPDQEHHLPSDLYVAPVKALVSMKLVETVRQRLLTGIPD